MKKYVTIPFNTYKELDKDRVHNTSKETDEKTADKSVIDKKIEERKEKESTKIVSDSPQNSSHNSNNSGRALPHSESPIDEGALSDSGSELTPIPPPPGIPLPPPGIPKIKKSISIIKHNNNNNNNNRITRNKGRWYTPWKTRFS